MATDPDVDDTLSYALSGGPLYGQVAVQVDGGWTYTPANRTSDYQDQFTVVVEDSGGLKDLGNVTIDVTADDDSPQQGEPISPQQTQGGEPFGFALPEDAFDDVEQD